MICFGLGADDPKGIFGTTLGVAGIVVTSGTDTLEETAYFLNLTVRSDKPVVVVGSMRNPSTLGYEGAANLLEGFRVAASPDARSWRFVWKRLRSPAAKCSSSRRI